MRYLFFIIIIVLVSCKPCRECKYSTLKGSVIERSCSSIKGDLKQFEEKMDSTAKYFGTEAVCTKEKY